MLTSSVHGSICSCVRLHVVRLVERVDDGLPVRRDHRGEVPRGTSSGRSGTERAASGSGPGSRATARRRDRSSRTRSRPSARRARCASRGRRARCRSPRTSTTSTSAPVERVAPPVERAPERPVGDVAGSARRDASRGAGTRCGSAVMLSAPLRTIEDRLVADRRTRRSRRPRGSPPRGTRSARPAATAARIRGRGTRGRCSAPSGSTRSWCPSRPGSPNRCGRASHLRAGRRGLG